MLKECKYGAKNCVHIYLNAKRYLLEPFQEWGDRIKESSGGGE
jgi:hypothetical protein